MISILNLIWIIPITGSFALVICSLLKINRHKDSFTLPKEFVLDVMKVEDNKRIRIIQHCEIEDKVKEN